LVWILVKRRKPVPTLPLAEAKAQLSKLVDAVESRGEQITITRHGRPVAMLVPADEIEGWRATVEILRDPEFMEDIRRGLRDLDEGRVLGESEWDALFHDRQRPSPRRRRRRSAERPAR
jgi:prevent-host-death family protein